MTIYQTIHTDYGLARIAAAAVTGVPINLTHMAVGDGSGSEVIVDSSMTALVHERHRTTINRVQQDPANPKRYFVEMLIPAATGGWTIREFGIFDDAGSLFAVGTFPATYKTIPLDGATNDLVVRVELIVSNAGVITLMIDPSVAIASQAWVLTNINAAALIPGGTTHQVLRKASNTDGDTEWADPASATILVDVVEEPPQAIAALQLTMTLAICNTTGLAVYIDGLRIPRQAGVDGWQPGTSTQVVLGKQYTAGSIFTAFQNDPASNIPDPLTASLNLSDVQSVATARTNLGVYSKAESDQLQPAGNVAYSARITPPAGWLVANGALVSRSVYAVLFDAIGTTYGAGDGSTTFALPDLRGEFIRGLDSGRGIDIGRTIGSPQLDAIQNIIGAFGEVKGDSSTRGAATGAFADNGPASQQVGGDAKATHPGITFDASRVARTAAETRPRNVALLPIIKF